MRYLVRYIEHEREMFLTQDLAFLTGTRNKKDAVAFSKNRGEDIMSQMCHAKFHNKELVEATEENINYIEPVA